VKEGTPEAEGSLWLHFA